MTLIKPRIDKLQDQVFNQIHKNNLVYNTCWEDPRCDRELLTLSEESHVIMITSAGCNTLDYLLDSPATIKALDINPKQSALLNLKLATFNHATFDDLYKLFGQGYHPKCQHLYADKLRPHLTNYAKEYWDKKIRCFKDKRFKGSFYFYGTSGHFAWLFKQYLKVKPKVRYTVHKLLEINSLSEQRALYQKIEPKIVSSMVEWLLNKHLTMAMLGVPRSQRRLIIDDYPGGLIAYIKDSLRAVFKRTLMQDNYFWHVYLKGHYRKDCCPNYLKPENFDKIRKQTYKVTNRTCSVSDFLKENPGHYTHFALLDHQDWLAANSPKALEVEWRLILKNSRPGAKILFRSAAREVDFLPEFVKKAVRFEKVNAEDIKHPDRVGTYASAYLGIVK